MGLGELSVEQFMSKDWGDESSNADDERKVETKGADVEKPKKQKKRKRKSNVKKNATEQPDTEEPVKTSKKIKTNKQVEKKAEENQTKSPGKVGSKHQKQLDSLKEKDPEFYKFLQEEESSLLNFADFGSSSEEENDGIHKPPEKLEEASDSDLDVTSSDDEPGDEGFVNSDEEDMEKAGKKKRELITVTDKMLEGWKSRLVCDKPSFTALRQLMQAFHASLARIDALEEETVTKQKGKRKRRKKSAPPKLKYKIVGSATFNAVIGLCLSHVTPALAKILQYFPDKMKQTKRKKHPLPFTCERWASVRDILRSYLHDVVVLAQSLLEPSVNRVVLRHLLLLLPYFVSFPKISKSLLKYLIKSWSSDDNESIRVLAFLCITRLIKMEKDRFLEHTMKQTYMSYVANCKFSSPTTLPMINFMQRTFAEICAVDADHTYRFAFLYIRQLAVHLRKAITTQNKETRQAVYNWQFIHCVGLWCRVLSVLHPNATLQPLIYPLVQIALGVIDLVPTPRFYPLRFQIVRSLTALADCTDTYIPLLPSIVCPLKLQEFQKKQIGVTVRPIAFETILKLSNSQLKEKSYRDTTMDHVYDLLMTFFNTQAHTIAFPEMSVSAIIVLKKFIKDSKTQNYSKIMRQVVEKVQANSDFINKKRLEVSFQVTDIDAVKSWENDLRENGVPFHKVFFQYKKDRQRELAQQIADKDRSVDEKLPSIDRKKFMNMSKSDDREEFSELFQGESDEEEIRADFDKAIEQGKASY
uniref:Nucleolar complex protein 2 homolog n=1 Tax=Phallusia mammillata TaxID=59560 RepID=A0A6F9DLR9_9ASCI|nr:nucleolar complex protein 2 homolog [Phallusia mammillata]